MSDSVEDTDNLQVLRECANEEDSITPYGLHCAAEELESLRTRLQRAEELLRESLPHIPEGLEADARAFLGERP